MNKFLSIALLMSILCPFTGSGQMRNIYLDADSNNHIVDIQFYSSSEGYVAFEKGIGFTSDSGHIFSKRYISIGNVNYNGYNVNLTFGFDIKGIHVFSKDSILVYGDYGFVPAILFSADGGLSYRVVYHATLELSTLNHGIVAAQFPGKTSTGYAIERNRILKTLNRGQTWTALFSSLNENFAELEFPSIVTGFTASGTKLLKTSDGGTTWVNIYSFPEKISCISFINENTGWILTASGNIYQTKNGGTSWQIKNPVFGSIRGPIKFVNDSTGYSCGEEYTIYKSTDAGSIWEPLSRNNNFTYLGYSHESLFFQNEQVLWAGGGLGFMEHSVNGGGATLPVTKFDIDLSDLELANKIRLNNLSKTGYQYKWFRNASLIATSYNAEYISARNSIDTISLVVIKGIYSDTLSRIIDTRTDTRPCDAAFVTSTDTSTAKFTASYNATGVKHFWEFGDGMIDSVNVTPIHSYSKIGNYTIKHKVYNTISRCQDSTQSAITIIRTQNCLSPDFTYTADSFYTNAVNFSASFDNTKESGEHFGSTYYSYGDGKTGGPAHTYDSAKVYMACLYMTNIYTGCVSSACKPVEIKMETGCNADFQINGGRTLTFNGLPHTNAGNKRNQWQVDDGPVTGTGNLNTFQATFFKDFRDIMYGCGTAVVHQICLDSINKKIRHIIYDSTTLCSDTVEKKFIVPRSKNVFIKAVPDPNFAATVTFSAYQFGSDSSLANQLIPLWRIGGADAGVNGNLTAGPQGSFTYTFGEPGIYSIAIGSPLCVDGEREIYYINYKIAAQTCNIYPPDFIFSADAINRLKIQFGDLSYNVNASLGNSFTWYFGDGDSATTYSPSHEYTNAGTYTVILRYRRQDGCIKEKVKQITVSPACVGKADFSYVKDNLVPGRFYFNNTSTGYSDAATFKWYFGNGDSASGQNIAYTFKVAGNYPVKLVTNDSNQCIDSVISIITVTTRDICNLNVSFSWVQSGNNISFIPQPLPVNGLLWDFGDGTTDTLITPVHSYDRAGHYRVCLTILNDPDCEKTFCDTVSANFSGGRSIDILPNPVTSMEFTLRYFTEVNEPITITLLNGSGLPLRQYRENSVLGVNLYKVNAAGLNQGTYIIQITGANQKTTRLFMKL